MRLWVWSATRQNRSAQNGWLALKELDHGRLSQNKHTPNTIRAIPMTRLFQTPNCL